MVRHIPDGQDFSFPKDFGFSGSVAPQHTTTGPGGPKPYAKGGAHKPAKAVVAVVTPHEAPQQHGHMVSPQQAQNAIRAAVAIGAMAGAKAARSGQMGPGGAPGAPQGGTPAMRKGGHFAEGGDTGPAMDEDDGEPLDGTRHPQASMQKLPPFHDLAANLKPMRRIPDNAQEASAARAETDRLNRAQVPAKKAGGKFLQSAVKHPGRLKEMAKREGISTSEAADKASHSSDPSLRAAGNLGKRFIHGDLSHHGKRKG